VSLIETTRNTTFVLREGIIGKRVSRHSLDEGDKRLLADVISTLGAEPDAADTRKVIQNYVLPSGEFDIGRS
jgi:hypothetical protein